MNTCVCLYIVPCQICDVRIFHFQYFCGIIIIRFRLTLDCADKTNLDISRTHTLTRFDLSITRLAFEIRYIYEFVRSFNGSFHSFVLLELILILAALVSVPPKTISFQRFSAFAKRLCVCVIPHFVISIVRVVLWRHVLLSSYPGSLLAFNNNNSSNNDNIIKPVFHWEII